MVLLHFSPITSSPAPLEGRGLHAVHQHSPRRDVIAALTHRDSARKLQSWECRASFWVSKPQIIYYQTPLPWAGHEGKPWQCYEDSPFLLQAKLGAGQASPLGAEQGLRCLSGVWVLSTAQVTAQAQGTRSCHSLFRVADHDLLVSGVLQDPLLPFSQEYDINLQAGLMSC